MIMKISGRDTGHPERGHEFTYVRGQAAGKSSGAVRWCPTTGFAPISQKEQMLAMVYTGSRTA
ncbi:hypothetical protein DENIS_4064 [Desulfonema ishimotonii]|uniref:Uncharacterized protein n=1 Tax=Desulfonema ishimotonii TaxID=45657 RepID=A0A401G1I9_9BACT|nr:hypothetical protein DENIS_4064 [Desulfonema ishimotonii]